MKNAYRSFPHLSLQQSQKELLLHNFTDDWRHTRIKEHVHSHTESKLRKQVYSTTLPTTLKLLTAGLPSLRVLGTTNPGAAFCTWPQDLGPKRSSKRQTCSGILLSFSLLLLQNKSTLKFSKITALWFKVFEPILHSFPLLPLSKFNMFLTNLILNQSHIKNQA